MNKKLIKLLTLVLAIAMVASIAVGCDGDGAGGGNGGGNSTEIEFLVNPEDYKGTTVTYVTWRDPKNNEDGVAVEAFEEKYGINVEVQLVDEPTYVSQISSSIIAGKQGDVFFQTSNFPGCYNVMQSLEAAKINYDDPIWNQNTLKASSIDGVPYLVDTVSNVFAETDLVVYNKALFSQAGITSPKEYFEAGNWTFETFRKAAMDITAAYGKSYVGANALADAMLGAAGCTTIRYQDGKFVSGVDDKYIDVMTFIVQMVDDGYLKIDRYGFNENNVGMAITQAFALKKTGYFPKVNPDHFGVTYLPTWKQGETPKASGILRGWGLIEGAPNPEAAGIFLREYLDVSNYDIKDTFINDEASTMFFQITALQQTDDMTYYFTSDFANLSNNPTYFEQEVTVKGANQVKTYFESQKNVIAKLCEDGNGILETERAQLKK